MDNYKLINKELVDQIREMRNEISVYKQEIVLHKAEIMEQHRLRVEEKQKVIGLLTQQFKSALNDIDPELNIQNLLINTSNYNEVSQINSKNINQRTQSSRSSKILMDFRRRSSNFQLRKSSVKMSPTSRRSVKSDSEENVSLLESDDIQSITDNSVNSLEENDLKEDEESIQQATECLQLGKIVEEISLEDITPKKVISEHEEQLVTFPVKKQSLLRDITNLETTASTLSSPLIIRRRVQKHSCLEDSIEEARFANEIEAISIETNTINATNFAISDLSMENFFQAPSSTPSHDVVEKSNYNLRDKTLINTNTNHSILGNQNINDSTSSSFNSRPQRNDIKQKYAVNVEKRNYNLRDKTIVDTGVNHSSKENQDINDSFTSSSFSSTYFRPQRNCIKKSYAEPTLKVKLRGEGFKTKKQKKKSAKK